MNIPRLSYRIRTSALMAVGIVAYSALDSAAQAQIVVLDDFEVNEGHFTSNPNTGSGTTQGFFEVAPATIATADRVTTDFFDGLASQFITLDDDPNVGGTTANLDSWRLRHLSGGGTVANNVPLSLAVGGTSYVGYWMKTSSVGIQAGLGVDDGLALEIGRWQNVPADGLWHFYEWQFQDANDWDAFAGTGPNGIIDSATVTIDSVFLRGGVGFGLGTDFDAQFHIDRVSFNPTGSIVPEPAGLALLALGALAVAARRRRQG
jgi:hypothetical protein